MTLDTYVALPWTVRRSDHDDDGPYIALTIDELPGFIAAGRTGEEAEAAFWDALKAFLRSYLDAGERPPLPARAYGIPFQTEMLELTYKRPDLTTRYTREIVPTTALSTRRLAGAGAH